MTATSRHSAIAIAAIALGVSAPVFADGKHIEEEVIVTATRSPYSLDKVPYSIRVIDAQEIRRSAASHLGELLRNEGSLQVRDSLGNGRNVSISLRGMSGGQNAAILVDGRRLNNSDLSEPDLAAIVLQDIERIEVLEGGAGVLFGDQAVGGVINVITRTGATPGGRIVAGGGSYDARTLGFSYGGTAAAETLDFQISGQRDKADGYRDNTEVDFTNLRAAGGYRYGAGRLFVEGQRTENDYLLPGALMDDERRADRRQAGSSYNDYRIDTDQYRIGVDHSIGDIADILVSYGNRDEDVAILGRSLSFGDTRTGQRREVETFDPRVVLKLGSWRVTVGSDIENYDYDLSVDSAFGLSTSSHRHERRSQYIQGIYSFNDDIQLSAGYRHAKVDVDVDGGYFTARYDDSVDVRQVGLSYRVTENLRAYVNRDETFRFALADENVDFLGNVVSLKPQEGVAWELGSQWHQDDVELGVAIFDHAIENEIGYDTNSFANINFDDTRRRGATLSASLRAAPRLAISASLTRMSAEFDGGALDGNPLPGVSETLAKVAATFDVSDNFQCYGEAVYTGPVAIDMYAVAEDIPGFTVYNLAASYNYGNWTFKGRLNNLFGKEYSELVTFFGLPAYYPSPERNANVSVQYQF
ncbi:MAG: TonB-dependent receptor [Porticoccaceae bacterium]